MRHDDTMVCDFMSPDAGELLRLIVLMPTRGTITLETQLALSNNMDSCKYVIETVSGKPVVEARNELVRRAQSIVRADSRFAGTWLVLWIDSDSWWPSGTISRIINDLRPHSEFDIVFGCHTTRRPYWVPSARKADGTVYEVPPLYRDLTESRIIE